MKSLPWFLGFQTPCNFSHLLFPFCPQQPVSYKSMGLYGLELHITSLPSPCPSVTDQVSFSCLNLSRAAVSQELTPSVSTSQAHRGSLVTIPGLGSALRAPPSLLFQPYFCCPFTPLWLPGAQPR